MSEIMESNVRHGKTVDILSGAVQGRGYGKHRYKAPKPPFNWSHRYQFNIYTLDCVLDLPASSRKRDLLRTMEGYILQQAIRVGHYR